MSHTHTKHQARSGIIFGSKRTLPDVGHCKHAKRGDTKDASQLLHRTSNETRTINAAFQGVENRTTRQTDGYGRGAYPVSTQRKVPKLQDNSGYGSGVRHVPVPATSMPSSMESTSQLGYGSGVRHVPVPATSMPSSMESTSQLGYGSGVRHVPVPATSMPSSMESTSQLGYGSGLNGDALGRMEEVTVEEHDTTILIDFHSEGRLEAESFRSETTLHTFGQFITSVQEDFESDIDFQEFINSLVLGPVNLSALAEWGRNAENEKDAISRFTVIGLAAQVSNVSSRMQQSDGRIARIEKKAARGNANSQSDEAEAEKFAARRRFMDIKMSLPNSEVWETSSSVASSTFHGGVSFRDSLKKVQLKIARECKTSTKPAKNQSDWEEYIQAVYYKMLRSKEKLENLTYRTQNGIDNLHNVYELDNGDHKCTESFIDFLLNIVGKKDSADEVEWCGRIASTILVALAKNRRSMGVNRKRRKGEQLRTLSYFARIFGEESSSVPDPTAPYSTPQSCMSNESSDSAST